MRSRLLACSCSAGLLLAATVLAVACGRGEPQAPATSGQPAADQPAGERGARADGSPFRVCAVLMQQDQFFRLNENGMRAAASELGVDLKVQNAGGAQDKEVSILDTFMTQKADAILISPLGTQASIPGLQRAHERGIKIITYNNGIAAAIPDCSISSDQVALGSSTGRAAREYIEKKLGGKARVALIGFASQLPEQGGARQRGFKQEIADMPGVTIVAEQDAWNAPEAASTVAAILTKKPDLVWAANEGGTVGAVTAVRNAGKQGQTVVFGTDISAQLVSFLLADDGILQAVTAQKPFEMGRTAVESAVKVLKGEAVQKDVVLPGILFSRDKPDELRAYAMSLDETSG